MACRWSTSVVVSALLTLTLHPTSVWPAVADDVPTCFGMPATIVGIEVTTSWSGRRAPT
jgi:hypothetical protein